MRELILKRIEEFRKSENNFHRDTTRWRNYTTVSGMRIPNFDFSQLSDEDLLREYERLVRQLSKMM